jgi:hypothetical protein
MGSRVVRQDMMDNPDLGGLREPVDAWVGLEADEREPAPVGDPMPAGV